MSARSWGGIASTSRISRWDGATRQQRASEPLEAVAVVSTDELVPERVLAELRENPAVEFARAVEIKG